MSIPGPARPGFATPPGGQHLQAAQFRYQYGPEKTAQLLILLPWVLPLPEAGGRAGVPSRARRRT
jgi:hypothetical protein